RALTIPGLAYIFSFTVHTQHSALSTQHSALKLPSHEAPSCSQHQSLSAHIDGVREGGLCPNVAREFTRRAKLSTQHQNQQPLWLINGEYIAQKPKPNTKKGRGVLCPSPSLIFNPQSSACLSRPPPSRMA